MVLSNRGVVPTQSANDGSSSIEAYKRVIVESAADESVRVLDAKLKRHPWRGDGVQIELRWTCERSMKIRT